MRAEEGREIAPVEQSVHEAWDVWVRAARREIETSRGWPVSEFPHFSENGRWRLLSIETTSSWRGDRYEHGNWTAGFWFGVFWLLALQVSDERADEVARERLRVLSLRAEDSTTHDLGFLFFPSFGLGYEAGFLRIEETAPAIRAAEMMARRFNERGEYIQAFGPIGSSRSSGTSTIDTMMNLPLLWWAAAKGADPAVLDVARRHARTSARLFPRRDGSTYQLIRFDPLSGAVAARGTFQGAAEASCWSRGQAWAVCGFAWAYAATLERELLEAAEVTTAYFFDRLAQDAVPPWDFDDRSADAPRDASASAIAALGAHILGVVHPQVQDRRRYADLAARTLVALSSTCLNVQGEEDGILLHCCYSKPDGLGLDGSMGWGDFYFGLALALARGVVPLEVALGFSPAPEERGPKLQGGDAE